MTDTPLKLTRKQISTVIGMVIGGAMAILDIQVTNASLKHIQGSLNASFDEISWIATSYLVAEIVVIPVTGFFSQIFGTRRYILVNAFLFLAASALCGLAWSLPSMIAFRALQGITGGVLIPMTFNILLRTFPPQKHATAMAIFSLSVITTISIGPTLGGWLTDLYNWRVIFFINIPLGIIMLLLVGWGLEKEQGNTGLLHNMDWLGLLTMALGLGSLQIILEEGNREGWFESDMIVKLTLLSFISLAVFIYIEFTHERPFINLRLLSRRNFALGSAVSIFMGIGLYGSVFLIPLFLGEIRDFTPLQIGLVIFWMAAPQIVVTPFIPVLLNKIDPRLICAFGAALFAVSSIMNSHLTYLFGADQFFYTQIVRAVGQPLMMVPITTLTMLGIEKKDIGSASGLFNSLRNLGGSVGIAVIAATLSRREDFHYSRLSEHVSQLNHGTVSFLDDMTGFLQSRGSDTSTAASQGIVILNGLTHRESLIMAFNDAFYIIGAGLFISIIPILLMKKEVKAG